MFPGLTEDKYVVADIKVVITEGDFINTDVQHKM